MKKANIFLLLLIIIFANACNKESVIEGTVVKATVVSLNKTVSLYNASISQVSLNIAGNNATIQMQASLFKVGAGATNVTVANDSLRFNYIGSTSTIFILGGTGNALTKFTSGDEIPTNIASSGSLYLAISKKSTPYTSPYTSINSTVNISGGAPITPQFSQNNDGYIAFKYTTYSATSTVNYYGWIHVILTQNEITFDKYAYQKDFPIKVGQEE
jgi:hypothetical protein